MRRRPSFVRTVAELLAGFAAGIQEFRKSSREIQEELGLLPPGEHPELDENDWRIARFVLSLLVSVSYAGFIWLISTLLLPNHSLVFALACTFAGILASALLRSIFAGARRI